MKLSACLLPLPLLTLGSCIIVLDGEWDDWGTHTLRGSGVSVRDDRHHDSFDEVSIWHAIDVDVTVGEETSVRVEGDDNLVGHVETRVDGGMLVIDVDDDDTWFRPRAGLHVYVTTPYLEGLHIAGSSDVTARGIDSEHFSLSIAGSGDVTVHGRTDELEASISGSGDMDLSDLQATRAELSISGSGDIEAAVSHELEASISGSGDISYIGDPSTSVSVSGSGSVHRD